MASFSGIRVPARRALGAAALLAATLLLGCEREVEKPGPADSGYYPLQVGDFRVFDVVDSTWSNNVVPTPARYQFRERVAEEYTDAAGRKSFRVVRSRRLTAADAWRDDSVLVVSPSAENVLVTRNNRRTVDLVFPVRDGYWNWNAFNELNAVSEENMHYIRVGQPFTATSGTRTFPYEQTVTVSTREDDGNFINAFYYFRRREVYAKDNGPVWRSTRRFTLCNPNNGNCIPSFSFIYRGSTRTETLVEKGRL